MVLNMQINSNYKNNNISFGSVFFDKSIKKMGKHVYKTTVRAANSINHKNNLIKFTKHPEEADTIKITVSGKLPDDKNIFKRLFKIINYKLFSVKVQGIVSTKRPYTEIKAEKAIKNVINEYRNLNNKIN